MARTTVPIDAAVIAAIKKELEAGKLAKINLAKLEEIAKSNEITIGENSLTNENVREILTQIGQIETKNLEENTLFPSKNYLGDGTDEFIHLDELQQVQQKVPTKETPATQEVALGGKKNSEPPQPKITLIETPKPPAIDDLDYDEILKNALQPRNGS